MTAQDLPAAAPRPTPLAEAIGGVRGLIDSGAPAVLFVIVAALSTLRAAVLAAVGCAALLAGVRLARREPLRFAVSGCLGVGISAFVALRMGSSEGFFLPGIAVNAVYGIVFLGSIVVRRPLVSVVVGALGRPVPQGGVAIAMTALWAGVFLSRTAIQGALYLAGQPGWLAAVRIGMGWPLTFLALAATTAAVRPRPAQNSVGTDGCSPRNPS
jgi:Protein of unknown function (DUF3159)